jgi:hypothetical protein
MTNLEIPQTVTIDLTQHPDLAAQIASLLVHQHEQRRLHAEAYEAQQARDNGIATFSTSSGSVTLGNGDPCAVGRMPQIPPPPEKVAMSQLALELLVGGVNARIMHGGVQFHAMNPRRLGTHVPVSPAYPVGAYPVGY